VPLSELPKLSRLAKLTSCPEHIARALMDQQQKAGGMVEFSADGKAVRLRQQQ
jgi:hypothetical protein